MNRIANLKILQTVVYGVMVLSIIGWNMLVYANIISAHSPLGIPFTGIIVIASFSIIYILEKKIKKLKNRQNNKERLDKSIR